MNAIHSKFAVVISSVLFLSSASWGQAKTGHFMAAKGKSTASSSQSAEKDPRLANAYRFEQGGWVYIHLEGAPANIGYQHGYLLAPERSEERRVGKECRSRWSPYH